jgi:hypothetical protein
MFWAVAPEGIVHAEIALIWNFAQRQSQQLTMRTFDQHHPPAHHQLDSKDAQFLWDWLPD